MRPMFKYLAALETENKPYISDFMICASNNMLSLLKVKGEYLFFMDIEDGMYDILTYTWSWFQ